MSLLETLEAPVIAALANDIGGAHRRILNCIHALRSRAPLSHAIDVDERLLEVVLVF